jgi:hypothetical protein
MTYDIVQTLKRRIYVLCVIVIVEDYAAVNGIGKWKWEENAAVVPWIGDIKKLTGGATRMVIGKVVMMRLSVIVVG